MTSQIVVSPASITLGLGEQADFTARLANGEPVPTAYEWRVEPPVGGQVTAHGDDSARFIALAPGTYVIRVQDSDQTLSGETTVVIRVPSLGYEIPISTPGVNNHNVSGAITATGEHFYMGLNNDDIGNSIESFPLASPNVEQFGSRSISVGNTSGDEREYTRQIAADSFGNLYAILERVDSFLQIHVSWSLAKLEPSGSSTFAFVTDPAQWDPHLPAGSDYLPFLEVDPLGRIHVQTNQGMIEILNSVGAPIGASPAPTASQPVFLRDIDNEGNLFFAGDSQIVRVDPTGLAVELPWSASPSTINDLAVEDTGRIFVAVQDSESSGSVHVLDPLGSAIPINPPADNAPLIIRTYKAGMNSEPPGPPEFTVTRAIQKPLSICFTSTGDLRIFDDLFHEGAVAEIRVDDGGLGYTAPPLVTIDQNFGIRSAAVATAVVEDGSVVAVTIENPGAGYDSSATASFAAAPAGGTTATGTAFVDADISAVNIVQVQVGIAPK